MVHIFHHLFADKKWYWYWINTNSIHGLKLPIANTLCHYV